MKKGNDFTLITHTNTSFLISLNNFSEAVTINCGVSQGFTSVPLLFLLHINDIPQALSSNHIYLYGDNTCTFCYQHKNVSEI